MMTPRWAAGVMKRIATGRPVPSPKVKTRPRAVVIRRVPRRTNRLSNKSSSRSIGRPHHVLSNRTRLPSPQPDQVRRTSPNMRWTARLLDQSPSFPAMRRPIPRHGLTFARLWVKQRIRMVARAQGAGREVWLPVIRASDRGGRLGAVRQRWLPCSAFGALRRPARRATTPAHLGAGRELQRQARARAVCGRLHRRRLPQGAAGPCQEPEPVRPRELPARALHQQPRKRGGALQLSAEASGRARAARTARGARHATRAARRAAGSGAVLVRSGRRRPAERGAHAAPATADSGTRPPRRRARRRVRATTQRLRRPRRRLPRRLRPRPSPPEHCSPRRATSAAVSSRTAAAAAAAPPAPEAAPPPPPPAPPPPQFDIFD